MKILIGHTYYQSHGGEDAVAEAEAQILRDQGEEVEMFTLNNKDFQEYSVFQKFTHLMNLHWSNSAYKKLRAKIQEFKPDVVHFHNIYYMMTPAVYYACKDEDVGVVQSLHNFRPLCSNGLFFRDNQVCEDCLEHGLEEGIKNKCFHNSRVLTRFIVRMIKKHRQRGTWQKKVDRYITATDFTRQKYIQAGFPAEKIKIKPNAFDLPMLSESTDEGYVLFLGRFSHEKGIDVLLEAYKGEDDLPPLKILGDGPLKEYVHDFIESYQLKGVEVCGFVDNQKFKNYMKGAKAIIIPSKCYENFPRVVVEALAYGVPVICSALGSLKEIIDDQETGLFFNPSDAKDLTKKIKILATQDLTAMRLKARLVYEERYASKKNYQVLKRIYEEAVGNA